MYPSSYTTSFNRFSRDSGKKTPSARIMKIMARIGNFIPPLTLYGISGVSGSPVPASFELRLKASIKNLANAADAMTSRSKIAKTSGFENLKASNRMKSLAEKIGKGGMPMIAKLPMINPQPAMGWSERTSLMSWIMLLSYCRCRMPAEKKSEALVSEWART